MIIANVSPSLVCAAETHSTLQFVSRAKCIRNRATINLDYRGDVKLLQVCECVRVSSCVCVCAACSPWGLEGRWGVLFTTSLVPSCILSPFICVFVFSACCCTQPPQPPSRSLSPPCTSNHGIGPALSFHPAPQTTALALLSVPHNLKPRHRRCTLRPAPPNQNEIVRLNSELDNLRKGFTDPAIQENATLRKQVEE